MTRWRAMGAVVGVLAAMSGCSEARSGLGPGEACVRSTECRAGLACVGGTCTDDLSSVQGEPPAVLPPMGEGGMGAGMDGAVEAGMDAGPGGGGMEGGTGGGGMDAGPGGGGMEGGTGGGGMDAGPGGAGG